MESLGIIEKFSEANVESLAVVVFKDEKSSSPPTKDLDKFTGGHIADAMKNEEFKGESGETSLFRIKPSGKVKASLVLLIGVGSKADYKLSDLCVASGTATRYLRKCNAKTFAFLPRFDGDSSVIAEKAVQGAVTSQFELDKYKTKDKKDKAVTKIVVCVEGAKAADIKTAAQTKAKTVLEIDLQRLIDLQKTNDHVRPAEIELAQEQLRRTGEAIEQARLRLDSLRLIVEGPAERGASGLRR